MIENQNLIKYKDHGFDEVEGWCSQQVFHTVDLIDRCEINKIGGALEIGVHSGKLFILINQIIDSKYKSYAIDIFDDQYLNIDYSGHGSLEIFKKNLENYDVHQGKNTTILKGDSTDRGFAALNEIERGSQRLISVDGGHTVEHTISDLTLAEKLISNEGVVILDDIMNHHWLGVIEGAFRYIDRRPTLLPFAIGQNKLYFAKLSFRDYYYNPTFPRLEWKNLAISVV